MSTGTTAAMHWLYGAASGPGGFPDSHAHMLFSYIIVVICMNSNTLIISSSICIIEK